MAFGEPRRFFFFYKYRFFQWLKTMEWFQQNIVVTGSS
ncbi:hypothetical protein FTV88_2842 [Heliorestis convoluta]|uniref:Uncharacterized protein n=1 Tax=Heliorestis convoluta TaxID=356322 RepID=A0A5Q2N3M9_9FIRM|nr:hypothetical protein FTV88_2842 [Heliorestis convoluta]